MLQIGKDGGVVNDLVTNSISTIIQHGAMPVVRGIIVH